MALLDDSGLKYFWGLLKDKFAAKNHTHKYAGSASVGGSANSAVKLDTATAGSATQPVYFSGGKPVATTYTLGKSVPADAKFTDTNTWRGVQNNLTSTATDQSLSAAQGKVLKDTVDKKADNSESGMNTLLSKLTTSWTATPTDDTYFVRQDTGGGNTFGRVKFSTLWTYIKSKSDSIYQAKGNYATSLHTHTKSQITDFPTLGSASSKTTRTLTAAGASGWKDAPTDKQYVPDMAFIAYWNGAYSGSSSNLAYCNKGAFGTAATKNTGDFATASHGHNAFGKATADAAGSAGYVPAPAKGQQGQYLRGDGTWATPTNTTYGDATTSAHGLMTAADKAKLNGIASNANNYSHPTSSGNKHIPAGGAAGQILRWSADGTATWGSDNNTTYSAFKGATTSAAGGTGLVPAPGTADVGKVLKGSGSWGTLGKGDVGLGNVDNTVDSAKSVKYATSAGSAGSATNDSKSQAITGYIRGLSVSGRTITFTRGDGTTGSIITQDSNTTYGNMTGATANAAGKPGLVPAPAKGTQGTKYLRADGTWQTPPDTNTTYGTASQSANGLMSAADKKKLDGIASGANNFTYSLPTASATVLGGVKTGSNITNTSGVLSLTKANVTSALGYTPPTTNTTYGNATTSSSGLMSSSDKSKLDGIASGANKTVVDGSLSATSTNPVQNKVVYAKNLWLYGGTYKVDSWTANTDGTYTQSAAVTPTDGGPALTASMNLSAPMTAKTTTPATNVTLGKALAIINTGSCVAAAASVAIKVMQKPSCDITVYWYAR